MKEKIISAIVDMKTKVERDSKHIYRDPETGDMYQGVSTVSSIVPKDWLSAWGAKEAVKALGYSDYEGDTQVAKEILAKIKSFETPEQLISLLKESKGAAFRKSKQAMIDGKAGHDWLEQYVKSKCQDTPTPPMPEGLLERPIKQFLEWEKENIDSWIASEAFVVYPEKRYAGQLDAIGVLKTGELCIIDFKFASNISEDYYLQTAGYAAPTGGRGAYTEGYIPGVNINEAEQIRDFLMKRISKKGHQGL